MAVLRKVGRYYYAYFYDRYRKPKRKCFSLRTTRKSVAEARLKELELAYARGDFDPWNPNEQFQTLTIVEACQAFLEARSHIRPKTRLMYMSAINKLDMQLPPGFTVDMVRANHVHPLIEDQSVSPETRRHRYRHLRAFFNWCVLAGNIKESPLARIKIPKAAKKIAEFLTPEQLERLFNCIDADCVMKKQEGQLMEGEVQWLKDLILLAVGTGLRRGELVNLQWKHVDLDTGFIEVRNTDTFQTKSGNERRVPLVGDALALVKRLRKTHNARPGALDNATVLCHTDGRPLAASYASKRFKFYVRLAKLPEGIRFHSLRHTCASWLVMKGVSLPVVQQILGHSNIQVTQRYAHLAPDVVRKAMVQAFES